MTWNPDETARRMQRTTDKEIRRQRVSHPQPDPQPVYPELPDTFTMLYDIIMLRRVEPTPVRISRRFGRSEIRAHWPLGTATRRYQKGDGYTTATWEYALFADGRVYVHNNEYRGMRDEWEPLDPQSAAFGPAHECVNRMLERFCDNGTLPADQTDKVTQWMAAIFMRYASRFGTASNGPRLAIADWMKTVHPEVSHMPGAFPIVEYRALVLCLGQMGIHLTQQNRVEAWNLITRGFGLVPDEVLNG